MKRNENTKYDFPLLKKDFFLSPYKDVKGFFEGTLGVYNNFIVKKTAGWADEKVEWKYDMVEMALKEAQIDEAHENAKALKIILGGLRFKISEEVKVKELSIAELERLWNIFMTMNGFVTRMTSQLPREDAMKNVDYGAEALARLKKYTDESKDTKTVP
jgi:hypothetical protein